MVSPLPIRLGVPTNLRPAGAHKDRKRVSRSQVKRDLRNEVG